MNPRDIYAIHPEETKVMSKADSTTHINIDTDYYLPNLDEYIIKDTKLELLRRATLVEYDSIFAAKLCDFRCEYHKNETPVYEFVPAFLDFHYQAAKNRNTFINHLKYVILSDYITDFEKLPAKYFDLINQWLDQKVNIKTRYKSYGRSVMFCLRLLQDRADYKFKGEREKVITFIESRFINPDTNKAPNGRSIYNAYPEILIKQDISAIKKKHESDYKAAEELLKEFI